MSGGMRRSKGKGRGPGGMPTSNVPRKMPAPVQSKKGKRKTKQQVKKQKKKLESVVSRVAAYYSPFWRSPACSPSTGGSCWSRSPPQDHTLPPAIVTLRGPTLDILARTGCLSLYIHLAIRASSDSSRVDGHGGRGRKDRPTEEQ